MSNSASPQLAAVVYSRGFDIDRLLVEVCAEAARAGVRLGGLLQVSTGDRGGNCAATVHVVDLRTQAAFDIWENRGACAQGCRLDERGLADAVPVIVRAITDRVGLIVINRFGRAESLGKGLLDSFAAALEAGIPVLSAVREPYVSGWRNFHGGLGVELSTSVPAILGWMNARPDRNQAARDTRRHQAIAR